MHLVAETREIHTILDISTPDTGVIHTVEVTKMYMVIDNMNIHAVAEMKKNSDH